MHAHLFVSLSSPVSIHVIHVVPEVTKIPELVAMTVTNVRMDKMIEVKYPPLATTKVHRDNYMLFD